MPTALARAVASYARESIEQLRLLVSRAMPRCARIEMANEQLLSDRLVLDRAQRAERTRPQQGVSSEGTQGE